MDADKSPQNSYTPHSRYIENKGSYCFPHTLHHALDHNRYTIKRFGNSNHTKYRTSQTDNLRIWWKQPDQYRRKNKQQTSGNNHQSHFQRHNCLGKAVEFFIVIGPKSISCKSSRCCLHSISWNIKSRFYCIGNSMGCRCSLAQRIDHGCKCHISKGRGKSLKHIWNSHLQTRAQNCRIRQEALTLWRYISMLP